MDGHHGFLPYLLLGEEWEVAMTTRFHFSGSEGQRLWLPSLFPARRGMGGGHDHSLPLLRVRRKETMVASTPSF